MALTTERNLLLVTDSEHYTICKGNQRFSKFPKNRESQTYIAHREFIDHVMTYQFSFRPPYKHTSRPRELDILKVGSVGPTGPRSCKDALWSFGVQWEFCLCLSRDAVDDGAPQVGDMDLPDADFLRSLRLHAARHRPPGTQVHRYRHPSDWKVWKSLYRTVHGGVEWFENDAEAKRRVLVPEIAHDALPRSFDFDLLSFVDVVR